MTRWIPVIILGLCAWLPSDVVGWWNPDWDFRKQLSVTAGNDLAEPLQNAPVLVRLHIGNFAYFMDMSPTGADLRFVAPDDQTPLPYVVDTIDTVAGLLAVWVRMPVVTSEPQSFYMYYGNPAARSAESPETFWGADTVTAFHFNEASGVPRDGSAYARHATNNTAQLGAPGLIAGGLQLNGRSGLEFGGDDLVRLGPDDFTWSAWIYPESTSGSGVLLKQGDVALHVDQGLLRLVIGENAVFGRAPLKTNQWQQVSLSHSKGKWALWINGREEAQLLAAAQAVSTPITLGGSADAPGFLGRVDVMRLARKVTTPAMLAFNSEIARAETSLVTYGEDETRDSAGGSVFGLLWATLDSIRVEGWIIIATLIALGLISFDIIISKGFRLARAERRDRAFLKRFDKESELPVVSEADAKAGPLQTLHQTYLTERENVQTNHLHSAPAAKIESVRSNLDAEIASITEELNERVALITMAVSGGPFLGLLGTVLGVMVTFAAISVAGDVNVRTIAPGVAAALTTTVVGLLVAIPSLFGYNFIAGRIVRRTTAMEVFADRLMAQLALTMTQESGTKQPQDVQDEKAA